MVSLRGPTYSTSDQLFLDNNIISTRKKGMFGLGQKTCASSNWRSSPAFYIVPEKYRAGPKSVQTPVPFRPPAGQNPDWSITMIFMQLTTQLIHYHVLICIIICYKPKENIIILLSPLELKSDFASIETP